MKGIDVKTILQKNNFVLSEVADSMGETAQNLQSMLKSSDIKTGVLQRIAEAINKDISFFFEVGEDGAGLPLNKFINSNAIPNDLITSDQVDSGEKSAEGIKVVVEVKLVRKDAYVAYLANWHDASFIQTLPTKLTMVKNYEKNAIYRAFDVGGSGMDCDKKYAIEDGDTVTCINVAKEHWSTKLRIKQHREWVVVYDEGIILTHIFNHSTEEGTISCRFYNEDKTFHPDIEIRLSDVTELFYVISVEKNRF